MEIFSVLQEGDLSRGGDSDPGPTVYKTVALPLSYLGNSHVSGPGFEPG